MGYTLDRHRDHIRFWVKDGLLFETYFTSKGVASRRVMQLDPDTEDNDWVGPELLKIFIEQYDHYNPANPKGDCPSKPEA